MILSKLLLLLLLGSAAPDLAAAACTAATCLNGGTCDPSYVGSGFRCKCPREGWTDYGPRCELAVLSYISTFRGDTNEMATETHHDVTLAGHPFESSSLVVTFEFVAHCHLRTQLCTFFVMQEKNSRSNHKRMVSVEVSQTSDLRGLVHEYYIWTPANPNHADRSKAIRINDARMYKEDWNEHWQSLSLHLRMDKPSTMNARTQVCSIKTAECVGKTVSMSYAGHLHPVKPRLIIGRMFGCIKFLRVNGVLADLGNWTSETAVGSSSVSGTHKFVKPFCPFKYSCMKFNRGYFRQNFCGKDSQCNGEVGRWFSGYGDTCTCRCINGKRRPLETITNSDKCTNAPLPSNECSLDVPALVSESKDVRLEWSMPRGGVIAFGSKLHNFLSLEAFFKTYQLDVPTAFHLLNPVETLPYIKISQGSLHACLGIHCYAFPAVTVSDGEWHFFALTIRNYELTAMLDMVTKTHVMTISYPFTGATVAMSFPESCVRAVRLLNIYMPTGDADTTADDASNFIELTKGNGVRIDIDWMSAVIPTVSVITPVSPGSGNPCKNSCTGKYQQCIKEKCECTDGYSLDTRGVCAIDIDLLQGVTPNGGHLPRSLFTAVLLLIAHQRCSLCVEFY